MIVTMYKGCILTANYQEVFDTKIREGKTTSVFEDYLESLDKKSFNVNGYVTDSGSFNIAYDLDGMNAFECNYVRFMSDMEGEITVYAFVDSVIRSNNCITVNYTVDVFHTYFPVCSLRDSLISNFRNAKIGVRAELPLRHTTNDMPVIMSVNTTHLVYVVVQFSYYNLVSGGNERQVYNTGFKLAYFEGKDPIVGIHQAETILSVLKKNESLKSYYYNDPENGYYYEVGEAYYINADFNMKNIFNSSGDLSHVADEVYGFIRLASPRQYVYGLELFSHTFANSFYRLGVGVYTDIIKTENNNTDLTMKVLCYCTAFEFALFLSINGCLYDISRALLIEAPFRSITGEVAVQRNIERAIGTVKGITSVTSGGAQVVSSIKGMFAKSAKAASLEGSLNFIGADEASAGAAESGVGIVGGLNKIIKGITDIAVANLDKNSALYGVSSNSIAALNAYYGIVEYRLVSDNNDEVNAIINELGYNVLYKVDALDAGLNTDSWDYNVVKFINAKVVGNAPQNILSKLREILENGVKIWYTKNVS